jgi:hypothetical protein
MTSILSWLSYCYQKESFIIRAYQKFATLLHHCLQFLIIIIYQHLILSNIQFLNLIYSGRFVVLYILKHIYISYVYTYLCIYIYIYICICKCIYIIRHLWQTTVIVMSVPHSIFTVIIIIINYYRWHRYKLKSNRK